MLWCNTVLNRNNKSRHFSRHLAAHIVVMLLICGQESESTTVYENDEWEILYRVFCGDKHAEPEVASWINCDIICLDSFNGFGGWRDFGQKEI
ncbi:hypothetical protein HanXRQr2_Chr05g0203121 [Helianthus annuus]|uniref:Uncharacterized protein n=1 Tax=Helianthus annuus TaxID=4232 RepID=A0A9K3IY03_HELAN|nr:hypothetical protein HanXRQr2_Chr05g0203121 [Helianthus annuus]